LTLDLSVRYARNHSRFRRRTADVGLSDVGFATDLIVPTAGSAGVGVRCNIAVGSRLTAYFSATGTLTLARVVARTVTTFGTARAA